MSLGTNRKPISTLEDADPGCLFCKGPRTESRTQASTMFHTTAGQVTSRAPFRWSEGQVAIFEAWVKFKGPNATSADLTPLLRALDLDGYEDVTNYDGTCVHFLILEKVRRKLSRTKSAMASWTVKEQDKVTINGGKETAAEVAIEKEEKARAKGHMEKVRQNMARGVVFGSSSLHNPTGAVEPPPQKSGNNAVHQPKTDERVTPGIKTEPKDPFQWPRNLPSNIFFGSMPSNHLPSGYEANPGPAWLERVPGFEPHILAPSSSMWPDRSVRFEYPDYRPPIRQPATPPSPPFEWKHERKQEQTQAQETVRTPAPAPTQKQEQEQEQTKGPTKKQAPATTGTTTPALAPAPAPALAPAPQQEPAPAHEQPTSRPSYSSCTHIVPPSLVRNRRLPFLMKELQRMISEFHNEVRQLSGGAEVVALETAAYDAELEIDHLGNVLNEHLELSPN